MDLADAQQAPRALGVPFSHLSLGPGCRGSCNHIPPPQAQACLLLQKALPVRELRPCFEDPEWELLMGQILTEVTEVTAVQLLSLTPIRSGSLRTKDGGLLGPCDPGWVCGCPRRYFFPRAFNLWYGKWLQAAFSLEPEGAG